MEDSVIKSVSSHVAPSSATSPRNSSNNNSPKQLDLYRGRFAPSPTGPLHFGSLIAATASYLCARQKKGEWLLRIEDVDTQREQQGSSQSIIQTLEDYGFEWDGDIRFQSQHSDDYQRELERLEDSIFACSCSRKYLRENAPSDKYSYVYPGFCRDKNLHKMAIKGGGDLFSYRIRTDVKICLQASDFEELCQQESLKQNIEKEVGDFVLKRRDGLFAYHLAVTVDDELQGITDVVRGADLFDNTPRQNYLQCMLGYHQPRYLHFPVAVDQTGKKFSKQNNSPTIPTKTPTDTSTSASSDKKIATLIQALDFLGQQPPNENDFSTMDDLWKWAVQNWDIKLIPRTLTIVANQ